MAGHSRKGWEAAKASKDAAASLAWSPGQPVTEDGGEDFCLGPLYIGEEKTLTLATCEVFHLESRSAAVVSWLLSSLGAARLVGIACTRLPPPTSHVNTEVAEL